VGRRSGAGRCPVTEQPFPFIVGAARSGTTLLRAMLTSHPEVDIPDESQWRVDMSARHGRYERPGGFDVDLFITDLFAEKSFEWFGMTKDEVRRALDSAGPATFADAVRAIFRFHVARARKTRSGDKTPPAIATMPMIGALFPETRFLHVIRDGRDVALSHV